MVYGNKPVDGGHLILSEEECQELEKIEPSSLKYIRQLLGAEEYINNLKRYCLWLVNADPTELKSCPNIVTRVNAVREFRMKSKKEATRKWAAYPTRFIEIRQPDQDYIIVPCHSSENRRFIPIGFVGGDVISNNAVLIVPNASIFNFGILTSTMHMAWMRYVCGRLEMRYRYSKDIVYNNFPWPEPTEPQRAAIEVAAQGVLDARARFPDSSLADLYDPNTMPPELTRAHDRLDKLVEKAYGRIFDSDAARVAFLFERYQKLTTDLFSGEKPRKVKKAR